MRFINFVRDMYKYLIMTPITKMREKFDGKFKFINFKFRIRGSPTEGW